MFWTNEIRGDGAAQVTFRNESAGKCIEATDPIDEFNYENNGSGSYDINSQLVVLGLDPLDTHTDNFWKLIATDTLTTTDSNVQLTLSPVRKYLWIQAYMKPTATLVPWLRFNNVSTGTVYTHTHSNNGGTNTSTASQNQIVIGTSESVPQFVNILIVNPTDKEKIVTSHTVSQNTAGEANTPDRRETVSKYANNSTQINEVDFVSSTSSFAAGSEFRVWGGD